MSRAFQQGQGLAGISQMEKRRVREFYAQTDPPDVQEGFCQTDAMDPNFGKSKTMKPKRVEKKKEPGSMDKESHSHLKGFAGADKLKQKAREASMKPVYDVKDYYHQKGCAQAVARSWIFENATLFVVFLNAIWIAIDSDNNKAPVLSAAEPIFIVAENIFCTYFFFEICFRFAAFERKLNCFHDFWFDFDLFLVTMMVVETWIVPLVFVGQSGQDQDSFGPDGLNIVRMIRLAKLLKLSRMVRILRAFPELVIILKGINYAGRSVLVFMSLWLILVYVFGIAMRQLSDVEGHDEGYFTSVPKAMETLLLYGVFPETYALMSALGDSPVSFIAMLCFLALVSITIMYMLVGVLVEVVGVIANVEKEALTVSFVATQLREALNTLGYNVDGVFTEFEFQKIMHEPSVLAICTGVGVDVVVLMDMLTHIYSEVTKSGESFRFSMFVDVVLSTRGSNPATVKDCKEQIKVMKILLAQTFTEHQKYLTVRFEDMKLEMKEIREDIKELQDDELEEEGDAENVADDAEDAENEAKDDKMSLGHELSFPGEMEESSDQD
mmetsp:Transcript_91238/g.162500  ORF Transcript_91238/g.162500 Transcript_91238/m.162500 type:complete len:553 (-) Transcript_91238:45-1703(-)